MQQEIELTCRKAFTLTKGGILCACPYGIENYVASGRSNGDVLLFPVAPTNKLKKLHGHKGAVTCIASCNSQPNLVTGSADGTCRVWLGNEEGDSTCLKIGDEIVDLDISAKFDRLLIAGKQNNPTLWDPRHCKKLCDLEADESVVNSVSVSSDGLLALTGSTDGYFRLYDTRSGQLTQKFNAGNEITATSVRQTGSAVCVGCSNGVVLLWDSRSQQALNNSLLHNDTVTSVNFHPTKPLIITSSLDQQIAVLNGDNRALIYSVRNDAPARCAHWSTDGSIFTAVIGDQRVSLFDEPKVNHVAVLPDPVNKTKCRSPTPQKLDKFNHVIPPDEKPPQKPEVGIGPVIRCEEAESMKSCVTMMHKITDQVVHLSKILSKIESRMNIMDEQIALLESEKRKQSKKALKQSGYNQRRE